MTKTRLLLSSPKDCQPLFQNRHIRVIMMWHDTTMIPNVPWGQPLFHDRHSIRVMMTGQDMTWQWLTSSHRALRTDSHCFMTGTASGWHRFMMSWPMFSVSRKLASCRIRFSSNFCICRRETHLLGLWSLLHTCPCEFFPSFFPLIHLQTHTLHTHMHKCTHNTYTYTKHTYTHTLSLSHTHTHQKAHHFEKKRAETGVWWHTNKTSAL